MLEKILSATIISTVMACSSANTVDSFRSSIAQKVVDGSQDKRTVLIGEFHYITEDNIIFRKNILPALAKEGYTHLVLEVDSALQPLADTLPQSIPELQKAVARYSDPSQLIETIQEAHKLGYQVHFVDDFSYQKRGDHTGRNKQIAENIHQRIYSHNPLAKIVGFLGAAHVPTKPFWRPDVNTVLPLGYFISQARGEEPYTMAILPEYKVPQYNEFEGKDQSVEIISLTSSYLRVAQDQK
ncbi:hypothetical protein HYV86_03295 [Candidatus Woesearchaeota archaeon]|nr:hypothetical protein [Candidatus Woesearchaeota archaeon]